MHEYIVYITILHVLSHVLNPSINLLLFIIIIVTTSLTVKHSQLHLLPLNKSIRLLLSHTDTFLMIPLLIIVTLYHRDPSPVPLVYRQISLGDVSLSKWVSINNEKGKLIHYV